MILDTIQSQIQDAMRAHDELRVSTLKLLYSALKYEKIAKMHDLSDQEELAVVQKEVKKRKDAIALYRQGGSEEKAAYEESELVILKEFLPEEMEESELVNLVNSVIEETGATLIKDMGKVMSLVKEKAAGKADGGKIAELVKSKLQ